MTQCMPLRGGNREPALTDIKSLRTGMRAFGTQRSMLLPDPCRSPWTL
jgi:hypothetical protein